MINWGQVPIVLSEVFTPRHATPGRSPLTAAARQCSRRPARHVVILSQFFSDCISAVIEIQLQPNTSQKPNRRGRFFRAKAQKKIAPDGSA